MLLISERLHLVSGLCSLLLLLGFAKCEVRAQSPNQNLQTVAEKSNFKETATYDEVMKLCRELAKSDHVHLTTMGRTSRSRSLPLLVIGDRPPQSPFELKSERHKEKLVFFVLGNIHAGEVCGKEALLMLAREFANGQHSDLLDDLVILFAPIYNADGNQPMSPTNRPGQHGPDGGMGQRANAQGLDLNRDHLKLESPEARGFAKLLTEWDPSIVIDTHTTNGSYHQYTLTYDGPRNPASPPSLIAYARDDFLPEVSRRMQKATGYKSFYYGNFSEDHRQWHSYPAWPRYGTQYVAVRGRISILSEAYAYASYRDRIFVTKEFVLSSARLGVERKEAIQQLIEGDKTTWQQAKYEQPMRVAIRSEAKPMDRKFTMLGYEENEETRAAKRGTLPPIKKSYKGVEFLGLESPTKYVARPYAYVIPAELKDIHANLDRHGIEMEALREDILLESEQYVVLEIDRAEKPFQDHRLVQVATKSQSKSTMVPAGSVMVKTNQDLGRLAMLLLEPESQDGLVTWNFFDNQLEVGKPFPVLRLPKPCKIRTIKYATLQPSRNLQKTPITFDSVFGKSRLNLNGSPLAGFRWVDGQHYVLPREGWRKIDASTGQSHSLIDKDALTQALARLPGINGKQSAGLIASMKLDKSASRGLWYHANDLYSARLDGQGAKRLTSLPGKEELATFSPDGAKVAFVSNYDLYVADVSGEQERFRQLTYGGNRLVRHGKADWVYYEEIYGRKWKGYAWSPDSDRIAFLEYDDTPVEDFVVLDHLPHRLNVERERYPKAGDPIPHVRLGIVSTDGGDVKWIELNDYQVNSRIITRFGWHPSGWLYAYVQDRAQRWLDFVKIDPDSGEANRLFRDSNGHWVDDPGEPHFLDDGSFLVKSDRDGWRHLYRFQENGELVKQITEGEWEVRKVHEVNQPDGFIYFSATKDSHLAENLYRIKIEGGDIQRLSKGAGFHSIRLAPGARFFIDTNSTLNTPPKVNLFCGGGNHIRTLDSNPVPQIDQFARSDAQLVDIAMRDGFLLPGILIRPADFEPNKKYPVWLRTYAGPHAQTVRDEWARGRARDHMLANQGMLVFHFDPRSASARGPSSTWTAYRQLGVQELKDLEDAADWLSGHDFVDGDRIGIGGYSYGGFMASYALTHSTKFCAGFAGAPVTDWRNYDAFYTERYMDTPQENPDGYARTSVVKAAQNLSGKLLLVHGAMDDNVHVQNSLQLSHELQNAGKDFHVMIYPRARHGIHSKHFYRLRNAFIRKALFE